MTQYTIRLATIEDAEAVAKVHVESWKSTYQGIFSDEFLNQLSIEKRTQQWLTTLKNTQHGVFLYVAETLQNMIVGFSCGGPERSKQTLYTGELYAIYLYKNYQGAGLGKQLFLQTAKHLLEHGHQTMLIWVAADNPAKLFYEAMGGKALTTKQALIGDTTINEISYGWNDISLLI